MANLTNTNGFVSNPQFSGGEAVTPLSGAAFGYANQGYGGLYVGTAGTLVVKTINGNVLTLVSASGFIPGIIGAVSASSTAANIIGFDPKPVSFPTTTQGPTTTSTSTTTAAGPTLYTFSVGSSTSSSGAACTLAKAGTKVTVYADAAALANGVKVYTDAGGTTPVANGTFITIGVGYDKWAIFSANGAIVGSDGNCT